MRPADATRRTIRLYVVLGSVLAALGVGVALGADPYPSPPAGEPVASARADAGVSPRDDGSDGSVRDAIASITIPPAAAGDASGYDDTSGQS